MPSFNNEQKEIEKAEHEFLIKLNYIFYNSLEEFNTKLKNSLDYIYYMTLPIIMASLEDKAYNPFSEIMEKYISFIVNTKMISSGYRMLPLGYSADLTFEDKKHIINIDVKTANINNPADFKEEIALGFAQTSYPGKLPSGVIGETDYHRDGINEVKTFPHLPAEYRVRSGNKLTITNGLLFIYPDYKNIIDNIRRKYIEIREILDGRLIDLFKQVFSKEKNIREFLDYKPRKERFIRREIIVDNLIRGYFIHNKKLSNLSKDEEKKLLLFSRKIGEIAKELVKREIKPVAIISISIPNGKLSPLYDEQVVSGKAFGKSIRYHYEKGKFKCLTGGKSRVIFIYYNKSYRSELKKYFKKIITYKTEEKDN